jgi:hypothetical protein
MVFDIFAVTTKQYFGHAMPDLRMGCDETTTMQAAECKGMSSRDLIKLACDSNQGSTSHLLLTVLIIG